MAREPLGIPLPSMPGPKTLCGVGAGTSGFLSSAEMDLGVLLESRQRVSPRLECGHALALSSRAVAAVSPFLSRGSRNLWLSHEAFPQGCPTCYSGVSRSSSCKSRQCRENRFPWNGLRHLGDSVNGGTTLEFLSPFPWRVPPLEMRWEHRELFSDHAGKGSLL